MGYAAGFPAYGVNMGTIGSVTVRSKPRNYRFRNCMGEAMNSPTNRNLKGCPALLFSSDRKL
ncbi:hypothetical protein E5357_08120 [Hominisplanchenecus murintestinalis]|uniref:Uncharacterized protein n=1 Tax=Hominisplanchenecus murintestinalis TaxID=2941517 RepID=A0AC61QZM6_9FIRM|nr:hypothetical protein E5357_08120 [Hominisplanchenecus murintestinalis]